MRSHSSNDRCQVNLKLLFTLVLLLPAAMARSQSAASERAGAHDSVVYRDTLVPSFIEIAHKPLRAGFEPMYGRGSYTSGDIPNPMSLANCDNFSSGSGNLYGLRLLAEIPLWGDVSRWSFEPAIYGKLHNDVFDWTQVVVGIDPTLPLSPGPVPLKQFNILHEMTAKMWEVGMEARFSYEIAAGFSFAVGPSIGLAFNQTYEKMEHFGNTTVNGVTDRTDTSGTIVNKYALIPGISLGASYELPLSKKLRALPSVEISFPFIGITPYWHGFQLLGGVSFLFDLTPRREEVEIFEKHQIAVHIEKKIDTVVPPPLTASIRALAVSRNGDTSSVVRMTVEEVRTRNAYPVLNYIFFGDGSSQFPGRYVQYATPEEATRQFKGSAERTDTKLMDLYRETLNILGDRLRRNPKTTVTLLGSTSNMGRERNDLALARSRAEAVKEYLVRIWRIEPQRINVHPTLLPERPSPLTTEEGQAENRRVEFRVDDEHLAEPIIVTNIEHLATPDRITLKPHIETHAGIRRTYASISAGGVELQSFKTEGSSTSAEKLWAPTEETLEKLHDSLRIDYDVWDSSGNHAHATSSIPLDVSRVTSERAERVERFSLILFGFDESRLEKRNEREIRKAAEMIPKIPVERILIQGFTDETGDAAHNDALSEERAEGVRKRLAEMLEEENATMPADSHTEGRGSRDLLYDNRLPEGRFFSRTVNITIQRAR